jgi:hypothetical protein
MKSDKVKLVLCDTKPPLSEMMRSCKCGEHYSIL